MARKNPHLDRAQAKAAKQKKIAIVLSVVLVLVLVLEVPKTLKMMNPKAKAPIVTADASAPPAATPTEAATPPPAAATSIPSATPSVSSTPFISSVQVTADTGQLTNFDEFASKDPFDQSVQKTVSDDGGGSSSGSATPSKTKPSSGTPKAPPAPPPTSAVVSLNGELMSVNVGGQFPTAGAVFDQIGSSLFVLDSLTAKAAKISIAGGSYASGAPSLTLDVGKAVTLQNTADGTRYTLILEPQGTQVPSAGTTGSTSSSTTSTVPTTTTPSVIPSSSSGG
jgi:hypothetical protein